MNKPLKLALARVMRRHNMGRIENAGSDHKEVRLSYIKKNGEEISRVVQPYEIKPHRTTGKLMVYLTDDKDGSTQIKSYLANRVRSVSKPLDEFDPEWPVQF